MLFKLFILLGVGVLAVALRSFQSSFSQKAGAIAILVVTYLFFYFITGRFVGRGIGGKVQQPVAV